MRTIKVPRRVTVFVVVALAAGAPVASARVASASPGVPSAPRAVKSLPGNHSARVTWSPPFSNGGHKVTQYRVIAYHDDVALAVNVFHSTATTQTMLGLKNGESYTFTVGAENSTGWSRYSARSALLMVGVPGVIGRPKVTAGDNRATVTWKVPAKNGAPIDAYRITSFVAGATQPARLFKPTKTTQVMYTLKNGKAYQFKVSAHNHYGWSTNSPVSATVVIK